MDHAKAVENIQLVTQSSSIAPRTMQGAHHILEGARKIALHAMECKICLASPWQVMELLKVLLDREYDLGHEQIQLLLIWLISEPTTVPLLDSPEGKLLCGLLSHRLNSHLGVSGQAFLCRSCGDLLTSQREAIGKTMKVLWPEGYPLFLM